MASIETSTEAPAAMSTVFDFGETTKVIVGPEEKHFTIHKDVLTRKSKFFRAALSGNFSESTENVVRLPETSLEVFPIYIQWLYTGKLAIINLEEIENSEKAVQVQNLIIQMYVLSDQLGDHGLQNKAIDQFRNLLDARKKGPTPEHVAMAYAQLPESSKLRKYILDWYLSLVQPNFLKAHLANLPHEFVRDVAVGLCAAMQQSEKRGKLLSTEKCFYHEHNDEFPKCT